MSDLVHSSGIYHREARSLLYVPGVFAQVRRNNMMASDFPHSPFFFESWYNIGRTVTLSAVGFMALIILLRGSGKRTLSKLNVFDFVFVVAVGSVFASSIVDKTITLVEGLSALATLIVTQLVLAEWAARSKLADRIINGRPTLLFSHG